MTPTRNLQSRIQAARERDEAQRRERVAVVRAERAEQSERNLTRELDRAHREIEHLKAQMASMGVVPCRA
jgi:hypothetical protein